MGMLDRCSRKAQDEQPDLNGEEVVERVGSVLVKLCRA